MHNCIACRCPQSTAVRHEKMNSKWKMSTKSTGLTTRRRMAMSKSSPPTRSGRGGEEIGSRPEQYGQASGPLGEPTSPISAHSEYGNTIGCIVREVCNLNDETIRGKHKEAVHEHLLKRIHQRFGFPSPYNNTNQKKNLVNKHALCKCTKAMSS